MDKITQIASLSKTAAILIEDLSARERYRHRSDLRKMFKFLEEKNKNVNKEDFMATFKKFQDMGIGSIVHGRGTVPTRFIWNYNLRDVGLAAKGKLSPDEMQALKNGKPQPRQDGNEHSMSKIIRSPSPSSAHDIQILLISPQSGDVERFKVAANRVAMFRQLLLEFGEQQS